MIPARNFFANHSDADLRAAIEEAAPLEPTMTDFERECLNEMRAALEARSTPAKLDEDLPQS